MLFIKLKALSAFAEVAATVFVIFLAPLIIIWGI
jgi:hypothetical protein